MKVSIVILTYKRPDILEKLLSSLRNLKKTCEIIVVDNNSQDNTRKVAEEEKGIIYLGMDRNIGVGARNIGMRKANGDILITLDDDIIGINKEYIDSICSAFEKTPQMGGLCFKVICSNTDKIVNWSHHNNPDKFSDKEFITNEITEGAVAYRSSVLKKTGYYHEAFFISHEGTDLACRIMNEGFTVFYSPDIVVKHCHAKSGRADWRRYYYDTRNQIWLVVRNYPLWMALRVLFIALSSMFVFSVRDGFIRYWFKGIIDGVLGLPAAFGERCVMTNEALEKIKEINKNRPNFFYLVKKRLFRKGIQI